MIHLTSLARVHTNHRDCAQGQRSVVKIVAGADWCSPAKARLLSYLSLAKSKNLRFPVCFLITVSEDHVGTDQLFFEYSRCVSILISQTASRKVMSLARLNISYHQRPPQPLYVYSKRTQAPVILAGWGLVLLFPNPTIRKMNTQPQHANTAIHILSPRRPSSLSLTTRKPLPQALVLPKYLARKVKKPLTTHPSKHSTDHT